MSAPSGGPPPGPGRITRALLERKLDAQQRAQILGELDELYLHRAETHGQERAARWLGREYRRLGRSLLFGGVLIGRSPGAALRPGPNTGFGLGQDIRHSRRGLMRAPLFSAAVIFIVGLGIGGTTLVFAVVDSVLVSPLPYPDSDRLVLLRTVRGEDSWGTSMADLDALTETPPPAFDEIAAYSYIDSRISLGSEVDLLQIKFVSPNYFPLLGIEPVSGRLFAEEEGRTGGADAVLITGDFRDQSFEQGEDALGSSLLVNGVPYTIVGILPDRLGPLDRVDVYPVLKVFTPPRKGPFFFPAIGRLGDGVSPDLARAQLAALSERIFPIWQDSFTQEDAILGFVDLKEMVVGNVGRTLMIVLTAVGFLLLIASANAASLMVARGMTRSREVSIRSALGASEGRILRLLLTEAALLAVGAALLAAAIAGPGLSWVRRLGVGRLPRVEEISLGPSSLLFFLAVTVASWAMFGLTAAIATSRSGTNGLASTANRATSGRGFRILRRALVGGQFAITIPLLVGAGLMMKSLDTVQTESYGFDPTGLASMYVSLPQENHPEWEDVRAFWAVVLPEIEAVPGVLSAGLADARPPVPVGGQNNFVLEDRPPPPGEGMFTSPWITADKGFFRTLGLRVVEGSLYNDALVDTMRTAVVDEAWAERFYPDESPIGRRFRSGGCTIDGCAFVEITGVVQDVKTSGLDDTRRLGTIYYDFARDSYSAMQLHIRTREDPMSVIPAVRRVIRERDPGIPIADVRTTGDLASESLMGRRYTSTLVMLLATIALLLSVVGVYGAMAYFVRQHVRDIGIRIALGGGPDAALRMVIRRGMSVAGVGTLVGLGASLFLTRYMAGLLYGVSPTDPLILASVCVATLTVALAATAIPGRAAARTDPAVTLREE